MRWSSSIRGRNAETDGDTHVRVFRCSTRIGAARRAHREVLAEGLSADELPGRNVWHEFEPALLDLIGEIAPPRIVGRREPCPAQRLDLLVGRAARCGASETAGTQEPVGRRVDHVVAGGHGVDYTAPAALDRLAHQNPLDDRPPFGRRQLDIEAESLQKVFGDEPLGGLFARCRG